MKCDRCGSPRVVTRIVIQSDKGSEELNLCFNCFQKFVKEHPGMKHGQSGSAITDFMLEALNYINNGLKILNGEEESPYTSVNICPLCKTSAEMIIKNKKAGCPECYKVFEKEISDVVFTITGKRYNGNNSKILEETNIEILKEKINKAVKAENYEFATILRSQMLKLKGKGGR